MGLGSWRFHRENSNFLQLHNQFDYNFQTGEGLVRSVYIREGKWTGEVMVNLVTNARYKEKGKHEIELMMRKFSDFITGVALNKWEGDESIDSFYWSKIHTERGRKTEIKERLMEGKETLREEIRVINSKSEIRNSKQILNSKF